MISLTKDEVRGKEVLLLEGTQYTDRYRCKEVGGGRWSPELKCWVFPTEGTDFGTEIGFCIANFVRQRIKFDDQGGFDCVSMDSKTGSSHGKCDECNYSKFEDEEGNKKEGGPQCSLIFGFLGFVVDKNLDIQAGPVMLGMSSTSSPTARKILTTYKMGRYNWWERPWKIGSVEREKNRRTWRVITATPGSMFDTKNKVHVELMRIAHEAYLWSKDRNVEVSPDDARGTSIEDEEISSPFA